MTRAVVAHIHRDAFVHNLQCVRDAAPGVKVLAVIKADGYGHGSVRAARALAGADAFGVHCLEEALQLRAAGIVQPIVVLAGFFHADELPVMVRERLTAVVHHPFQIEALSLFDSGEAKLDVWLKVDSGMHRLGFAMSMAVEAWQRLRACKSVNGPLCVMTHLACADEPDNPMTGEQIRRFERLMQAIPAPRSIANSAGVLRWPQSHGDWVRPGLMLYGISPFGPQVGVGGMLRPVMTLTAPVHTVNYLKKGDPVGYGAAWVCPVDMAVGVVAIGYGDGYPRHVEPGTPVLLRGRRVPIIGRVSMDSLFIDLSDIPDCRIGERVTLWGEGMPIEEVAHAAGTIPYELTCQLTGRVRFVVE